MLIGVMSDTHDEKARTKKAVDLFNREGVGHVLHAGDLVSPFMVDVLKELKAPLTGVFGNNDGDHLLLGKRLEAFPRLKIGGTFARVEAGGLRFGLLHGHDTVLMETLAGCGSIDVLVHGHTHHPEVLRRGPVLVVNPGETYGHLTGRSTVALIDTEKRSAEIIGL